MIRAVLFDLYGTLIDIETAEGDPVVYEELAKFLSYRGIYISADWLHDTYKKELSRAIQASPEKYPEPHIKSIWQSILHRLENPSHYNIDFERCSFVKDITVLHRSLTRKRFKIADYAMDALSELRKCYMTGIVSDCQREYAKPEMKCLGLKPLFDAVVLSGDYGFRKPDTRLFTACLAKLGVQPSEAIYVGNDVYRDILGATSAGMKCILVTHSSLNEDILKEKDKRISFVNIEQLDELPKAVSNIEKGIYTKKEHPQKQSPESAKCVERKEKSLSENNAPDQTASEVKIEKKDGSASLDGPKPDGERKGKDTHSGIMCGKARVRSGMLDLFLELLESHDVKTRLVGLMEGDSSVMLPKSALFEREVTPKPKVEMQQHDRKIEKGG